METLQDDNLQNPVNNENDENKIEVFKQEIVLIKEEVLDEVQLDDCVKIEDSNDTTNEITYTEDYENVITRHSVNVVNPSKLPIQGPKAYFLIVQPIAPKCIIESLIEKSLSLRTIAEQHLIIQSKRPTPDLMLNEPKKVSKAFNMSIYDIVPWICACPEFSKFYCWPCLLFSNDPKDCNRKGIKDLSNLISFKKRHENLHHHITACIKLKMYGTKNIQVNQQVDVDKYNEVVTANRYILHKLIDTICFFALEELDLRHLDTYENEEDCILKLLYFLASSDSVLKLYLDQSKHVTPLLKDIQRSLMSSISNILFKEIKREIEATRYVSIIVDDFGNICSKPHKSVVFRYITETGRLEERFVGLVEDGDTESNGVVNIITKYLDDFKCVQKLVAFSYDGAVATCGKHAVVQSTIKEHCPQSLFVHSYTQNLNLTFIQSLKFIKECKMFFDQLVLFTKFFFTLPKRSPALKFKMSSLPVLDDINWNYTRKLTETIFTYRLIMKSVLWDIIENSDEWDSEIAELAAILVQYLDEFNFHFFLNTFSQIFFYSDGLFCLLQHKVFDIDCCNKNIDDFVQFLQNKKNYFDFIWSSLSSSTYTYRWDSFKRMKVINTEVDRPTTYKLLYFQIIDILILSIKDRFADLKAMSFMSLLDVKRFGSYAGNFPTALFDSLIQYENLFDLPKLKEELIYLYTSQDLPLNNLITLKECIVKHGLTDVLPEVDNFISLSLTFPKINLSTESSASTVAQIKTFVQNSRNQNLPLLAMIVIEKKLLNFLKDSNSLHNAVIDDFAKTETRFALSYKK